MRFLKRLSNIVVNLTTLPFSLWDSEIRELSNFVEWRSCRSPYEILRPLCDVYFARKYVAVLLMRFGWKRECTPKRAKVAVLLMRFLTWRNNGYALTVLSCRSPYEILVVVGDVWCWRKSCRSPYEIQVYKEAQKADFLRVAVLLMRFLFGGSSLSTSFFRVAVLLMRFWRA